MDKLILMWALLRRIFAGQTWIFINGGTIERIINTFESRYIPQNQLIPKILRVVLKIPYWHTSRFKTSPPCLIIQQRWQNWKPLLSDENSYLLSDNVIYFQKFLNNINFHFLFLLLLLCSSSSLSYPHHHTEYRYHFSF